MTLLSARPEEPSLVLAALYGTGAGCACNVIARQRQVGERQAAALSERQIPFPRLQGARSFHELLVIGRHQ